MSRKIYINTGKVYLWIINLCDYEYPREERIQRGDKGRETGASSR